LRVVSPESFYLFYERIFELEGESLKNVKEDAG